MNRRELFIGTIASALGAIAAKLGIKAATPKTTKLTWKKYTLKTKVSKELFGPPR